MPPLVEADEPGHWFRCWYPVDTPAEAATVTHVSMSAGDSLG
jgi:hypothetical protein